MIATCHLVAGAAIGKGLKRPWLAWPAALCSHYLLDAEPHIDPNAIFGAPQTLTGPEVAWSTVDALVGIALILWLAWGQREWLSLISGAFFAVLPDLLCDPWLDWTKAGALLLWLRDLHQHCHYTTSPAHWELGSATQMIVIVAGLWTIRRPQYRLRGRKECTRWKASGV